MRKRGISGVIVTILLVLIAIIAIALFWMVFRSTLKKSTSELGIQCITSNLKIQKAETFDNILNITITREPGVGNISEIRFLITNNTEIMTRNKTNNIKELETKTFTFNDVGDVTDIFNVKIAAVLSDKGKKKVCNIIDEEKVLEVPPIPECGGTDISCGSPGNCENCNNNDYYDTNYCSGNDVYRDFYDWSCSVESCLEKVISEFVETCGEICLNGQCRVLQTGYVDPDGDATVTDTWDFSTGTNHFSLIDDGTRQPNVTSGDQILIEDTGDVSGDVALSMTSLTGVDTVTQVVIWVYGKTWAGCELDTGDISNDGSIWIGAQDFGYMTSNWYSITFSGLTWSQTDLDNLQVRLIGGADCASDAEVDIKATYAEVTYVPV